MPRKGRALEILVEKMQEFLGPDGIEVESPKIFYSPDGDRMGEIDVALRGMLGSFEIFTGVECRDRPKSGPQGMDWIFEIRGKQECFGIDRMIAVSTTGFKKTAIHGANKFKIDLLTIDDVENVNLNNWFETIEYSFTEMWHKSTGRLHIVTSPPTVKTPEDPSNLIILASKGQSPQNIGQFIDPYIQKAFEEMDPENPNASYDTTLVIEEEVNAVIGQQSFNITRISIPIRLNQRLIQGRFLLNSCTRLSDGELLALIGTAEISLHSEKVKATAILKRSETDPNMRDMRVSFQREDGSAFVPGPGSEVSLYGRKKIRKHPRMGQ